MTDWITPLLDSWDRQSRIVDHVAALIDDSCFDDRIGPDEESVGFHLCHIHEVRYYWLSKVSPSHAANLGDGFYQEGEKWLPIRDIPQIRSLLEESAKQIRLAVEWQLRKGSSGGSPYQHPILLMQHMIWHEGWHIGAIFAALRQNDHEPNDRWEEENVWSMWRNV